jgi:hypothetical protein
MRRMLVAVAVTLFAGTLHADEVTKRTAIILNEPVIVAGNPVVTLDPGKYVIRLMRHDHNPNIVQIMNDREDYLYTTVLAIPNYRLETTNRAVFRFWETPAGNPIALRAWFADGDQWGQEFVYPKGLNAKVAGVRVEPETVAKVEAPPIEETRQPEVTPEVFEPEPTPPPLEAAAEPAPSVTIADTPAGAEPLPATASPFFAFGLFGALAAGAGLILRKAS